MRLITLLVLCLPLGVLRAVVEVDSVNYPVWLQRGSLSQPLAPGTLLAEGDVVDTGATGRAWLSVDDGSVVKLGERARFVMRRAELRDAAGGSLLDAAFDVLRGAFRFTSGFFRPRRPASHQVEMQVGAVTIGIRGTDLWGRSGDDEDFVALLEGRIEASTASDPVQVLDRPLTLYLKRRGEPAGPVRAIEPATVRQLAPETELSAAAGIVGRDGPIDLVLMSLTDPRWVDASLARFRRAGFPVVAETFEVDGVGTTRLLLRGVVDEGSASGLRSLIAGEFGIADSWLLRR